MSLWEARNLSNHDGEWIGEYLVDCIRTPGKFVAQHHHKTMVHIVRNGLRRYFQDISHKHQFRCYMHLDQWRRYCHCSHRVCKSLLKYLIVLNKSKSFSWTLCFFTYQWHPVVQSILLHNLRKDRRRNWVCIHTCPQNLQARRNHKK